MIDLIDYLMYGIEIPEKNEEEKEGEEENEWKNITRNFKRK